MTRDRRAWVTAGVPADTYETLAIGLPASRLWSLLLDVLETRASARTPAAILEQWDRDRFVQPATIDQRALLDVDRQLLTTAAAFEGIELSPVAPLGVCAAMGRTSQQKVLSALRGTEVVSDPTNVLALECARRLRRDPSAIVRLATSHRAVRAQEIPNKPGMSASFRIFCLVTAGFERPNHALLVDAVAQHVVTMLAAFDDLERHGFAFPDRRVTLFATEARAEVAGRIDAAIGRAGVVRAVLDHPYYDGGVRYQIAARSSEGAEVLLADGGAFDWLQKLMANRKAVY